MSFLTAEQLARLARMTGEAHKDTADRMVSDADLDDIAGEVALMRDEAGLAPGATGYVVTVDLYRAAAETWRQKAGMIAEGFDFEAEGGKFSRSQAYDHYCAMAGRYAGMACQLAVSTKAVTEEADEEQEWWEE